MSLTSADGDLIASLNNTSNALNRYLPILIYAFGVTGNLLNIVVLSQKCLRTNPSAFYFLISSIAGVIIILGGLTSRMMSGYGMDLTLTIGWICKVRNVVLYAARTCMLWMILSATIDRWLSSSISAYLRQMSSLKNARRSTAVVFLYSCLLNTPIAFCYEANLSGALRGCYGSTYACRLTTDLLYAFGTTLLPLLLMTSFGMLTIKNVHHTRNRIHNMTMTALNVEKRTVPVNVNRQSKK